MNGDYTQADFLFKVRKAIRYIGFYGISRTLVKIKGQYHTKATADFDELRWINPRCKHIDAVNRNVAIIGCGNYSFSNIAYYLAKYEPKFLRIIYYIQISRALSLCKAYGGSCAVMDWRKILEDTTVIH